ncbi:hypothetical protein M1247_03785 [Mycobacterium sp. 21AC1]|uniref:hypothetical protein n=1 Tax=[Mycobacterium] appelbergii TaxID=2939269 RepID=UPI0029392119|nr:hypothetical protein [Mycobacterium sp. 21AC1]MDV3124022.1 hypothetical protein [Mycobacterium sp. 21AC1]
MVDTIRYDYGANHDALEAIQGVLNDAQALREEVNKVFNVLLTVYEGDAATALHQKHLQISNVMDGIIQDIAATRSQGTEQQHSTAALDSHLAGNF